MIFGDTVRAIVAVRHSIDHRPRGNINSRLVPLLGRYRSVECGGIPPSASFYDKPDYNKKVAMDTVCRMWQNVLFRVGRDPRRPGRKRLVVLGTGWGAMNIIRRIDVTKWDVTIISPRNFFAFTPLLPSACAGTVTERACMEPVRNKLVRGGKKVMEFYEAYATNIQDKNVICHSGDKKFKIPYDTLVIAVGTQPNTFNTPGVQENALFLKEVEHARAIKKRLVDCFEKAALPETSLDEQKQLLSFIVIGAGPTGVEAAAEIADFINEEAAIHWPKLASLATVTVIEMVDRCLPVFQRECSEFTEANLKKMGVKLLMKHAVCEVTPKGVKVRSASSPHDEPSFIPAGATIWASGLANVPLTKTLMSEIEEQKLLKARALCVDEQLRVRGLNDVYAIGDCTNMRPTSVADHAEELYAMAKSSIQGPTIRWLELNSKQLSKKFPQLSNLAVESAVGQDLTFEEFRNVLKACDNAWHPPPPTAQNANQQGKYLSTILNRPSMTNPPAFTPHWKGAMAYVGNGQAIMEIPNKKPRLGGVLTNALWRAFYTTEQMSFLNKCLCLFDWSKHALRGRDVGREVSQI